MDILIYGLMTLKNMYNNFKTTPAPSGAPITTNQPNEETMKQQKLYKKQEVKELEIESNQIIINLMKKFTSLKLQNKATNSQYMEFMGCTQDIYKAIEEMFEFLYENSEQ